MSQENEEKAEKKAGTGKYRVRRLVFFWLCGLAAGINGSYIVNSLIKEDYLPWQWLIIVWLVIMSWFVGRDILNK